MAEVTLLFSWILFVSSTRIISSTNDGCNLVETGFGAKTVDINADCDNGRIDWHYTTPYLTLHFERIGQYAVCLDYSRDYSVQQQFQNDQNTQTVHLRHRSGVSRTCALTNIGDLTMVIQPRDMLYMTTISYMVYTDFL